MKAGRNEIRPVDRIPPHVLIGAYTEGVFPMAESGEILWFSPLKRGVIPLDDRFHIPHGLKRTLKRGRFEVRRDTAFRAVMEGCADRSETWIDDVIIDSYCRLHELGFAHSVECWDEDGLQGGLYGVALGRAFFGESMFSLKADASKVALVGLVEWLRANDFLLLDSQWMTDHLRQFGGEEIPREEYLRRLDEALLDAGEGDGDRQAEGPESEPARREGGIPR
ncbi:MAG: leucyl/phenylalanyl-tRNA--protein transferase [Akkermansiaceae bacterium]|nr:leucyl/phenylalanyl-tRNA--protein transferase [Akkermansiaceae bacterium]